MDTSVHDFEFEDCREASELETGQWLLDDGPVLRTTWMVYDRKFPDGQREICATRAVRIKQNGPLNMPNRAKRGESEKRVSNDDDSSKRAKQSVRLRCKTISADRLLTLTYTDNVQDIERVKADWKEFVRRMGKCKGFHYVAVVERQERGAYHIHVAVRGRLLYDLVRKIWRNVIGLALDGRPGGNVDVKNPHDIGCGNKDIHKLASYLTKYISKDMHDHELNKKRYWSSRGIVVPEKNYYQLPYGVTDYEAFCHVMELAAEHNNDGMTFFSNQPLGVCWVATAPTAH